MVDSVIRHTWKHECKSWLFTTWTEQRKALKRGTARSQKGPLQRLEGRRAECGHTTFKKHNDPVHVAQFMLYAWTSQTVSSWDDGGVVVRLMGGKMLWSLSPQQILVWRIEGREEGRERGGTGKERKKKSNRRNLLCVRQYVNHFFL